jgi:hypothetical protein
VNKFFWPLLLFASAAVAAQPDAQIRVNQVGFLAGDSKTALLMATAVERNATFKVVSADGTVVLTAQVEKTWVRGTQHTRTFTNWISLPLKHRALTPSKLTELSLHFRHLSKSARARKFSRHFCEIHFSFFKHSATARMY